MSGHAAIAAIAKRHCAKPVALRGTGKTVQSCHGGGGVMVNQIPQTPVVDWHQTYGQAFLVMLSSDSFVNEVGGSYYASFFT